MSDDLETQIIDFSENQLSKCQYLVTLIDQHLAKQRLKSYFDSQDFCKETSRAYH